MKIEIITGITVEIEKEIHLIIDHHHIIITGLEILNVITKEGLIIMEVIKDLIMGITIIIVLIIIITTTTNLVIMVIDIIITFIIMIIPITIMVITNKITIKMKRCLKIMKFYGMMVLVIH